MGSVKQYKSTGLTILVMALVAIFGVGFVVDPDSSTADRVWGIVSLVAAAAVGGGLWCLVTGRLTKRASEVLIGVGLVAAGALAIQAMADDFSFFVWVFGPLLVLALVGLWFGVVKGGLRTELGR